jgi:hypothetical protein
MEERRMEWRPFNDFCLHCGDDAEVFTSTGRDNWAYDGDKARCVECGCPGVVDISGPDDEQASIRWHDEAGCRCEWCEKNYDEQGNPK